MQEQEKDHTPFLENAFSLQVEEGDSPIESIEGELPDWLRGSYYLNGPGSFSRGEVRYRHWLDGDGLVCALHFDDSGIRFVNRFVRSRKRTLEEAASRPLFRAFGTSFPGDQLNRRGIGLESPVNVSVYRFGKRLLAFGEQGLPWELDPITLKTAGPFTFGDRLNEVSPFSAHPKIDLHTGELFNFGVSFSGLRPQMAVFRFSGEADLVLRKRHPLDLPCSLHDFGLSQTYTAFYVSPYVLEMERLRTPGGTVMDALDWRPSEGSRLLLAARESGGQRAPVSIGNSYCLHFINVWEIGDESVVVDLLEWDEPVYAQYQTIPDLFRTVKPGRPVRYVVDAQSWQVAERKEVAYDKAPDFATIDPRLQMRQADDFWMLGISAAGRPGRKFLDQLVHCRWSAPRNPRIWTAPAAHYLGGEPVFLPRPGSREGLVLTQLFDAEQSRTYFVLFDAFDIERGPIVRLQAPRPVPPLFHASFYPR